MADRPILFSGPMVRALLEGRKTQTRRALKPQIVCHLGEVPSFSWGKYSGLYPDDWFGYGNEIDAALPYRPGDRLWVRESLTAASNDQGKRWLSYAADGKDVWPLTEWRWKRPQLSSRFMPRWASRLTLTVTDVRVQRLQQISIEDAVAEGVFVPEAQYAQQGERAPVLAYAALWESLNTERGFGWQANPWVVALTFTVERRNIDEVA